MTTFKVEVTVSKKSNVVEPRAIVWLCAACGRVGKNRMTVGDESCYLHAQAVYADSIVRVGDRVTAVAAHNQTIALGFTTFDFFDFDECLVLGMGFAQVVLCCIVTGKQIGRAHV